MQKEFLPAGRKWLCQRCGNCCQWPGDVIVTGREIDKIADYMQMDPEDFLEKYVEVTEDGDQLTLISQENHACIFLDEKNACSINAVKPDQCSGFPNTWFFKGWRDMCEAIEVAEEDFEAEVAKRDANFT
jgi:uncharacterized protein